MKRDWLTIVVVAGGIAVMVMLLILLYLLVTGQLPPNFPFVRF